jgi:hypothetical protein
MAGRRLEMFMRELEAQELAADTVAMADAIADGEPADAATARIQAARANDRAEMAREIDGLEASGKSHWVATDQVMQDRLSALWSGANAASARLGRDVLGATLEELLASWRGQK